MCDSEEKKGVADATKCILTPYGPPRARISHPGYLWPSWLRLERDVSEGACADATCVGAITDAYGGPRTRARELECRRARRGGSLTSARIVGTYHI